jgi:hypothetical protein
MSSASRVFVPVALFLAATCAQPAEPTTPSLLQTDSATYTATVVGPIAVTVRIVATLRNPSDTLIVLDRCTPTTPYPTYYVELIRPVSSDGAGYNPGWACVGHNSPLVVAARGTRTDTITLRGPTAYDNATRRFVGLLAGTFRIEYGGQQSNEFRIELPPGWVLP